MNLAELQELEARWLMQTYPRAPVQFVRGEGGETEVFFSDLSHGYVTLNAEYST